MSWNKYYTSTPDIVTFILGEMSYYDCFLITYKLTGKKESYVCYLDREKKVFSEHTLTEENEAKGEIGYEFFTNPEKIKEYVSKTKEIIKKTDLFKEEIDRTKIAELTRDQIIDIIKRAEPIYYESLGYYFVSQPEYTAKLNKVLLDELANLIPKEEVQEKFIMLIESKEPTCLEFERKEWLENIMIPFKKGELDTKEKDKRVAEHVHLYKYLSASSQFGLWDSVHFEKLLIDESTKEVTVLEQELDKIKTKKNHIEKVQQEIISKYNLPKDLVQNIETVELLSWLRLEAHLKGWQFFHYLGPIMVEQTAKILNLKKEDVFNLTMKEFISLLEERVDMTEEFKKRRNGNILTVITVENGLEVYFAQDAKKKYESEIAEVIHDVTEFSGQTASGTGKIRGEVFVFRWGMDDINERIYEFPDGKIIVAGQTVPQFMPAIRKAKAIITNEGGMLCHAAIVSRELKKPAIIGTKIATEVLHDGDKVEMDMDKGIVRIINQK